MMASFSAHKAPHQPTPRSPAEWMLGELVIARLEKRFGLVVEQLAERFACDAIGWGIWPNFYQLLIGMREERFKPKQIQKVTAFFGYEGADWDLDMGKEPQRRLF